MTSPPSIVTVLYDRAVEMRNLPPRLIQSVKGRKFDNCRDIETTDSFDRANLDVSADKRQQSWSYHPVGIKRFGRIMGHLPTECRSYCFIDIGSGKGRPLFMAAELGFREVWGVEHSAALHEIAAKNVRSYRARTGSRAEISVHNIDALDLEFPARPTVLLMFNPFKADVMALFLANLRESLAVAPRELWLVYVNPTERGVIESTGMFAPYFEDRKSKNLFKKLLYIDLKSDNVVVYRALTAA